GRRAAARAQDRDADESVGQRAPRQRAGRVPSVAGGAPRGAAAAFGGRRVHVGRHGGGGGPGFVESRSGAGERAVPGGGRAARGMAGGGVGRMAATNWHSSPPDRVPKS